MLDDTAKPTPTLPPHGSAVSICELTPITWPAASSSGPPELPGLIGVNSQIERTADLNPARRLAGDRAAYIGDQSQDDRGQQIVTVNSEHAVVNA